MATAKTTAQKKEKQARAAKTLKPADAGKEVKAGKRAERLAKASNVAFSLDPVMWELLEKVFARHARRLDQ